MTCYWRRLDAQTRRQDDVKNDAWSVLCRYNKKQYHSKFFDTTMAERWLLYDYSLSNRRLAQTTVMYPWIYMLIITFTVMQVFSFQNKSE